MRPGKVLVVLATAVMLIAAACAPRPAPVSAPGAPALESPIEEASDKRWNRLVVEGQREGKVVIYSTNAGHLGMEALRPFVTKHGIQREFISARGSMLSERLLRERAAGLYLVDMYIGGTTTTADTLNPGGILDPLEPVLMLPEVINAELWWERKLPWADPGRRVLAFMLYPNQAIAVNTSLVKSEEMRSWRDMLNPKWKGKILINDPTVAGVGLGVFAAVGAYILNWDYWRELVKQEPLITRDQRQQVEWLAHGKYPIVIAPSNDPVTEFQRAGAPIQMMILQEGTYLTSGGNAVSLINKAPHPSAARVFTNWLLSREGQASWTRTFESHSARLDVPTENVKQLRQPGMKYADGWTEEYQNMKPEFLKLAKEIFDPLTK